LTPYYYEDTSDHGSVAWVNSQKFAANMDMEGAHNYKLQFSCLLG
jgi:hypothetical protein